MMADLYTYYDALRKGGCWDKVERCAMKLPNEQRRFVMSVSKIEKAFMEGLKGSVDEAFEELNSIQDSDIPSDWASVKQAAFIRGCFLMGRVEELKLALSSVPLISQPQTDPRNLLLHADVAFIEVMLIDQHFTLDKIGTRNRRFIHEILVRRYMEAMLNFGQHQLYHVTKNKTFPLAQPFMELADVISKPPHEQVDFVIETLDNLTAENCKALLLYLGGREVPKKHFEGLDFYIPGKDSDSIEQWGSMIRLFGGNLNRESRSAIELCESGQLSARPALSFSYEKLRLSKAAFCRLYLMFQEFMFPSDRVAFNLQLQTPSS